MIDWKKLAVGDWVKVRYETGERFKGGTVTGQISKLWPNAEYNKTFQGQVEGRWCFHSCDTLLEHVKGGK